MEKKRLINIIILTVLIVGVVGITVVFAAIQSTLNITGTATMQTASWEVKFENLSAPQLTGAASVTTAPTLSNTSIGTFDVVVTKPGDSITYTFDVTNTGDLDGKIGTFVKAASPTCTGVSATLAEADAALVCAALTYTLKYTLGGATVAQGDTLALGTTKNMTLTLSYGGDSLPSDDVNITGLDITMIYVEDN